jgi:hypothetical protein
MKNKILALGLISLMVVVGLIVIGCGPNCPGNGECTVTIEQGSSGLYVDSNAPRSTCGKKAEYSSEGDYWYGGCKVQINIDNTDNKRTSGTQECNC